MLGRGVGRVLATSPPAALFADEVVAAFRGADLTVVNLECCGPRAAGSDMVDIELSTNGFLPITQPTDTYTYSFRITDPATGTVINTSGSMVTPKP